MGCKKTLVKTAKWAGRELGPLLVHKIALVVLGVNGMSREAAQHTGGVGPWSDTKKKEVAMAGARVLAEMDERHIDTSVLELGVQYALVAQSKLGFSPADIGADEEAPEWDVAEEVDADDE